MDWLEAQHITEDLLRKPRSSWHFVSDILGQTVNHIILSTVISKIRRHEDTTSLYSTQLSVTAAVFESDTQS